MDGGQKSSVTEQPTDYLYRHKKRFLVMTILFRRGKSMMSQMRTPIDDLYQSST